MRRLTYEFVKKEIEKEGYKLLSDKYEGAHYRLKIQCNKGHNFETTWCTFKKGCRCPECIRLKLCFSYKFVKSEIEKEGYTLLSKTYKNSKTKLKVRCPKNHSYKVSFSDFRIGNRCACCSRVKKLTYDYVKTEIEKDGYKLISKKYYNAHSKLDIKCNKGHVYKAVWAAFQQGQRCPFCHDLSGENHPQWRGGVVKLNLPLYITYAPQLNFCEKVRRDSINNDLLQVKCTNSNCESWFTPTMAAVSRRVIAINSFNRGEHRFYCSDECKHSCSLFRQVKYPKGFKPNHSRPDQKEWADLVKERDGYTCQKCGSTDEVSAHHFEGIYQNPIESADVDIGITLCKKCEKLAHSEIGCRYVDLQRKNICKKRNT